MQQQQPTSWRRNNASASNWSSRCSKAFRWKRGFLSALSHLALLLAVATLVPPLGTCRRVLAANSPLDLFCFYPKRDISSYMGCGLQYCPPQNESAQLAYPDLVALAQACVEDPSCESFNTNGWNMGMGLYDMLGGLELSEVWANAEQGVYVRRPDPGDPLSDFCFQPHLDIPGYAIGEPVPAYPNYSHGMLAQACLDTPGCL
ncbi:hypothetical protein HXX76_012658 [Chlamydomonas incerta]|uniref:Uncharacterized protein n=1 Tax=Chlamydomonas incerta TaxID=51695 RepID=A0A835SH91_CHLIN|nr:hypothetical protein HXX76_012658 [Chlamydomonas incerta]|eukprot:KAG2427148.1 hypothetical protein HXX76_012658 [Chlamydomonas incerta]